jgi:hypothetical protein
VSLLLLLFYHDAADASALLLRPVDFVLAHSPFVMSTRPTHVAATVGANVAGSRLDGLLHAYY